MTKSDIVCIFIGRHIFLVLLLFRCVFLIALISASYFMRRSGSMTAAIFLPVVRSFLVLRR